MSEQAVEPGIFIGIPTFGGMAHAHHFASTEALMQTFTRKNIKCLVNRPVADSLIIHARNKLFSTFLKTTNLSHFMFIDADIGFRPDDIIKLYNSGYDFCGGIYCKKTIDMSKLKHAVNAVDDPQKALMLTVDMAASIKADDDGFYKLEEDRNGEVFVECNRIATGFMMITRAAAQQMVDAYCADGALTYKVHDIDDRYRTDYDLFELNDLPGSGGVRMGEDYSFCVKWRKLGGRIMALVDCPLGHTGFLEYKYNLLDTLATENVNTNTTYYTIDAIPDDIDATNGSLYE